MSAAPTLLERQAGWPRLIRDVTGLKVRLARDVTTSVRHAPAGLRGTLRSSTSWSRLQFKSEGCEHCGVGFYVTGMRRSDFELGWKE